MKKVIILGSTGSIGTQTLEVISSRRDQFEVAGISAGGSDVGSLAQQIIDFSIPVVAVAREDAADDTGLPVDTFPLDCPYSLNQALERDFLPPEHP